MLYNPPWIPGEPWPWQGCRALMSRPLLSYLFKGQCVLAAAEFLLARLTSNEERKNRDWYVSPGKLLTPSRPSSFPLAPLAPSIPGHCPPQEPRSGATGSQDRGISWAGRDAQGSPGARPRQRDRARCVPRKGHGEGSAAPAVPAAEGGREGRDIPALPQVPLRLLRPPPLIPDPDSAVAQWKFCPFCEFSSRPAVPRCLAQAAALSSPEIVRKEHPWHGNEAAGAGPVSAAPGDAAHVALE